MHHTRRVLLIAGLLLIAVVFNPVKAQTTAHAAATDPLMMLPASDVVLVIDHSRILNEAIPRLFGNNTAPLAKIFEEGERFKAKTGVDPRSISRIAVGLRFVNPEAMAKKMDKKDFAIVIIGQGDFEASKFIDAIRREEKDKVREEQYNGQTLYRIVESSKTSTQPPETEVPALAVLDANTIALGDLAHLRATVDARSGNGRLSPELVSLVTRNGNALVSVAGNIPPALAANMIPTDRRMTGDGETDQAFGKFFDAVTSIKQMYLSTGLTASGIEAWLGARLGSPAQAQSLADMLLGARQQYSVFIDDKIVRDLVNSLQITAQGDEVQLRAEVPQATITMLLNKANKPKVEATIPSPPAAKPPTLAPAQPRKTTRRTTRRKRAR